MEGSPNRRSNSREQRNQQIQQQAKEAQLAKQRAKAAINKRQKKDSFLTTYQYHIVIGIFLGVCALALFSTLLKDNRKLNQISVIDEDEIENHNQQGYPFSLGKNEFFQDWSLQDAKQIISNQISSKPTLPRCMSMEDTSIIPDKFNFREAHPECAKPIVNQGNCSSSYAIAPVTAISDRICLQTKGQSNPSLSAQVLLSCDSEHNNQCQGGAVSTVLDYARRQGVVDEDCLSYQADSEIPCPTNIQACTRYQIQDYCVTGGEEGVKREIFKNGPVIAVIPVYKDFLLYKSGVYTLLEGTSRFQGGHALKLVGWDKDEETGLQYWIAENTWGETWGNNGLVNIEIGQKQLYIDEFVIAANPKVDKAATTAQEQTTQQTEEAEQKEQTEQVDLDEKN